MTGNPCVVASCDRPRPDYQFMCRGCVGKLERALSDVPALWMELEVTMTRQDAIGSDGGRKSADSGLPFKSMASEARWVLANTIGTWARLLADHAGISTPPYRPARWLLKNVQSIAMHPAADEAYDEIVEAVALARRTVDRMPELLLAGQCDDQDCRQPMYAVPTDLRVTCKCGREYETAERRDVMAKYAESMNLTAEMCRALLGKLLGYNVPSGTVRSWISRGRLPRHQDDKLGRPLYPFSEARSLAEAWHADNIKNRRRAA